jgi:hypothetical protein
VVAYIFQTGKSKIKLLKEYENVTQKVLLLIEPALQMLNNFIMRVFPGT